MVEQKMKLRQQAISTSSHLDPLKPTLVVCPAARTEQWIDDLDHLPREYTGIPLGL